MFGVGLICLKGVLGSVCICQSTECERITKILDLKADMWSGWKEIDKRFENFYSLI